MSRAPYGARGLKLYIRVPLEVVVRSRPVWGAWIEIRGYAARERRRDSRAPYGARGLKSEELAELYRGLEVAPRMGRVD